MNSNLFISLGEDTESSYTCPICFNICDNPTLIHDNNGEDCKHTFCEFCIQNWHKTSSPGRPVGDENGSSFSGATCPLCRRAIETLVPNEAMRTMLRNCQVRCNYFSRGCVATGTLNACSLKDSSSFWAVHNATCDFASVNCQHCTKTFQRNQLAEHQKTCDQLPQPCPYLLAGCSAMVSPRLLEEHVKKFQGKHNEMVAKAFVELKRISEGNSASLMAFEQYVCKKNNGGESKEDHNAVSSMLISSLLDLEKNIPWEYVDATVFKPRRKDWINEVKACTTPLQMVGVMKELIGLCLPETLFGEKLKMTDLTLAAEMEVKSRMDANPQAVPLDAWDAPINLMLDFDLAVDWGRKSGIVEKWEKTRSAWQVSLTKSLTGVRKNAFDSSPRVVVEMLDE